MPETVDNDRFYVAPYSPMLLIVKYARKRMQ